MEKSFRQSAVIALLVAGALFMEQLDGTVIATALPQMALSFGVAPVDLNIGISAYLLTVAVFIPASGWVSDRFGARVVFAGAIVAFTLSSVLCAASACFALGGVGTRPWRVPEAEQVLVGQAPSEAAFRSAAEIRLRGAQPQSQNGFKVELAKRCIIHALKHVTN